MFNKNFPQYLNILNQQQNESQYINNNQNINIPQRLVRYIIFYFFKL